MWVMSMGVGQAPGGTLMIIMTIFLAFAGLNFYMARLLRKQWNAHLRQKNPPAE
jgi:hypothetical protein